MEDLLVGNGWMSLESNLDQRLREFNRTLPASENLTFVRCLKHVS